MPHLATFISLLQFFFAPKGAPWWAGAVWGNVVALVPCGVIGAVWVKFKLFPLNIIHARLDELHAKHDALHVKHDQVLAQLIALHTKHDDLRAQIDVLASGSGGGCSKPACESSTLS